MREEPAIRNLSEVKEIFDKFGIRYWLDWGTLLGAVRNGKMIEWTDDIDLGTTDDSWGKIVSAIPDLEGRGFHVRTTNLRFHEDVFRKSISLVRFGCSLEIFVYKIRDGYALNAFNKYPPSKNPILDFFLMRARTLEFMKSLYNSLSFNETNRPLKPPVTKAFGWHLFLLPSKLRKILPNMIRLVLRPTCGFYAIIIPEKYFEKLDTMKFYEMRFNIPSKVEDYLEYHYGKYWRKPKKEWKYWEDDGAVFKIS